jgi:hypothetical protein
MGPTAACFTSLLSLPRMLYLARGGPHGRYCTPSIPLYLVDEAPRPKALQYGAAAIFVLYPRISDAIADPVQPVWWIRAGQCYGTTPVTL